MKKDLSKSMIPFLMAVILTACGGANKPSNRIQVTMSDFAFTPNAFTVPAGEQITFAATNNGAVAHSFVIIKLGHEVAGHFTSQDEAGVYWEQAEVSPGASVASTLTAPSVPGVYQVVCAHAGHFEAGMIAKLTVVAKP